MEFDNIFKTPNIFIRLLFWFFFLDLKGEGEGAWFFAKRII
jgi:hypothetical protein